VIILGISIALLMGLLLGGHLGALATVRLRFAALLLAALATRYGTQVLIAHGSETADALRLPLYAIAFLLIAATLWLNRAQPGLLVVTVGVLLNGLAIVANAGWMPVYLPALAVAGLDPAELSPLYHVALPDAIDAEFLRQAGPLGDVIPFPALMLPNVVSIGDVLVTLGLGWFVLATVLRGDPRAVAGGVWLWRGPLVAVPGATGAGAIARPIALGSGIGPGLQPPAAADSTLTARPDTAQGRHPYLRLIRDARFSAFWLGQTVSLFGDRLHQIVLAVMVYAATGSALQTGLVFLAATLPNLVLGPIAGIFVDRWDQKRVMVVSDLLRAGLVLLIPVVAERGIALVYPLVFLITAVSLFFRPAKSAVVPRIVRQDDLVAANSAIWTGETLADIAGYPLAGLIVAFLGTNLALAFWFDAATYLVSALLLVGLTIPPVVRAAMPQLTGRLRGFVSELRDGWHILRNTPALFQNTLISTAAQISAGATLALTVVFARDTLDGRWIPYPQSYAAIEAAIGIGNLVGGLGVGLLGARLRKGRMVVLGFVVMGLATAMLGLSSNALLAIGAATVMGIFNLVYVIPTQTLFGQLVPEGFMGRVVALRASLVFGAMTGAMAVCALVAEVVSPGAVIATTGLITVGAGLVGALLPDVRDA
jgi:MFS family permease